MILPATSLTSCFANAALTLGRVFSDTFAGIAHGSVARSSPPNSSAAFLAVALLRALYSRQVDAELTVQPEQIPAR